MLVTAAYRTFCIKVEIWCSASTMTQISGNYKCKIRENTSGTSPAQCMLGLPALGSQQYMGLTHRSPVYSAHLHSGQVLGLSFQASATAKSWTRTNEKAGGEIFRTFHC